MNLHASLITRAALWLYKHLPNAVKLAMLGRIGFVYTGEVIAPDGTVLQSGRDVNLIPQVGIDHIVGLFRGNGTLISSWYVGVFENNYVPNSGTTAADLPTTVGESTAYSETTRPLWNNTYDGVSVVDNLANRAEFTYTSAKSLYGGFLVSSPTKAGNSGTLFSIARFSTRYDVPAGSKFRLGIAITFVSAS